jgi:hypothetical protein
MAEKNVGGLDRLVRLVVGPVLLAGGVAILAGRFPARLGEMRQIVSAGIAFVIGIELAVTGVTQRCPVNEVLGRNTFRGSRGDESVEEPTVEATRPG